MPFLPEAEARIREALAVPAKKPGDRYVKPSGSRSNNNGEDASESTRRARKTGGRGYRRRRSDGSGGRMAVFAVLLVAVIVLVVIVAIKIGGSNKSHEADPPKQKTGAKG
jgi:hypothetical protein